MSIGLTYLENWSELLSRNGGK